MKNIYIILFVLLSNNCIQAQLVKEISGKSPKYSFNITKEVKPPIISIVSGSLQFIDINGNKAIDANEACKIVFTIQNLGTGDGVGLNALITYTGVSTGLSLNKSTSLPILKVGQKAKVEIPVTANMNTIDGKVNFSIKVDEPNGFGSETYEIAVTTVKFAAPMIEIVDYTITSQNTGVLAKKVPFDLQVLLQNTQVGIGENVLVNLQLPANVLCLSGNEQFSSAIVNPGEKQNIVYSLIVSDKFQGETIPITIKITEKNGKFAKDRLISLKLNQNMSGDKIEVIADVKTNNTNIEIGSLVSEVDKNIPKNAIINTHRYALVIGNEDYSTFQPGLKTEVNVDYALNDAIIFSEYCNKTLGIPEKQIKLLKNATGSQMSQGIAWLMKLSQIEKGNAEIFFYYSGHGLPDEVTKEGYLIPVDVSGSNANQGIKLTELYKKLCENPAIRITVLLDACFSGGARNQGLIAMKGVKINPKNEDISGNMVVFTSSTGEESSGVYREKQHGYFTYFFLKKLQETKGIVTYKEIAEYIIENVKKETTLSGKTQTPQLNYSSSVESLWSNWKMK